MVKQIDFIDVYDLLLAQEVTEPMVVLKHGKPCAGLLPYELFEALRKEHSGRALAISELSEEERKAIFSSEIPEELKSYDDEVES